MFFAPVAFSQTYLSKNYSTVDGLPNNSVYSIFKDSRGILWVGTENGIAAHQNGSFRNYRKEDGLSGNRCWALAEDSLRNLWIGTFGGGLTLYDGKKFQIIDTSNGLINNYVRKFFVFENHLFVGTEDGLSVIDVNSKKVLFSQKRESKKGKFQVMGFFDYRGEVYFGTFNDGFYKVDIASKSIKLVSKRTVAIFSVYQNKEDIYYGTSNVIENKSVLRISKSDLIANKPANLAFGNNIFWDFTTDKRGTTYMAGNDINYASGGLCKIENNDCVDLAQSSGVNSFETWCIHYDKNTDKLYVGTIDKGYYEVNLNHKIKYKSPKSFGLEKMEVVDFEKINSTVFIARKKGLVIQGKSTRSILPKDFFEFIDKKKVLSSYLASQFDVKNLETFAITALDTFSDKLWVSTTIGLFQLDNEGNFLHHYLIHAKALTFLSPTKMLIQVPYYHTTLMDFSNPSKPEHQDFKMSEKNNPSETIKIIKINNLLYFITKSKGVFIYKDNQFTSLAEKGIWTQKNLSIATSNSKGELVIANAEGDIFIVNVHDGFKVIKKIENKFTFGSNITMLECHKDLIIIGTELGLNVYRNGKILLIDEAQGLGNKIIISSKIIDNTLFVGTQDGYYEVDLEYLNGSFSQNPLNVLISSIEVNYTNLISEDYIWNVFVNKKLRLPFDKNNVSIKLLTHGAQFPNKLLYRYRIKELNKQLWSNWTRENTINLPYLPTGTNTIIVEVRDLSSGNTYSKEVLIIEIKPPFWETYWFVISVTLILLFILIFSYRRRIDNINRREKAKTAIEKRLVETKLEALQSQMNPHFIFNSLNSIQNFIISNETHEALKYMGDFSKLIRQTLNNSSKSKISLEEEIEYLNTYIELENLRRNIKVNVKMIVDDEIDTYEAEVPPMILQPFVENVFVHAFDSTIKNPELSIHFSIDKDLLICIIKDNGIGMELSQGQFKTTSKGIRLATERIELTQDITSPITFNSDLGLGTTVIIHLENTLTHQKDA